MRRVSRDQVPAPASLTGATSAGAAELAAQTARRLVGDAPDLTFTAYKSSDVRERLEELFHGKCAYCESQYSNTAPVDVEHYRPKGAIEDRPDLSGYWWLAMEWSNLLPSCIDCNRRRTQITSVRSGELLPMVEERHKRKSGKKDAFPIVGEYAVWRAPYSEPRPSLDTEIPLLLNPCEHQPSDHISFEVCPGSYSLVFPIRGNGPAAERGALSIDVYGLNRVGLVQARTRVLRQLEFLSMLAVRLFHLSCDDTITLEMSAKLAWLGDLLIDEMRKMAAPDQPYSMLVGSWLAVFRRDLDSQIDEPAPGKALPLGDPL